MIRVPRPLVTGLFESLPEARKQLPYHRDGWEPHITLIRASEIRKSQVPDSELNKLIGKEVRFTLGNIKKVVPRSDRNVFLWFVEVHSPEFAKIRRKLGFHPRVLGREKPHITFAIRPIGENYQKAASYDLSYYWEIDSFPLHKIAKGAKGIPDRNVEGDLSKLPKEVVMLLIQEHLARRAGKHYDIRIGTPQTGLYSWATKKEPYLTPAGKSRAWFRQPLHSWDYKDFEGIIEDGYGAGKVKKKEERKILVTSVAPNRVEFTLADQRYPERFILFRPENWHKPKEWLLVNVSGTKPIADKKPKYKSVPGDKVEELIKKMKQGDTVEAKIDGASAFIKFLKDHVEVVSYRPNPKTKGPLHYTERIWGGIPKWKVPKELQGTVLRGEVFGLQKGKAVPPQEVGGLLNATLAKTLEDQKNREIELKIAPFEVAKIGRKRINVNTTPRQDRVKLLKQIVKKLPKDVRDKFVLLKSVPQQQALDYWHRIISGDEPLTEEGIILHPQFGTPVKVKHRPEFKVYIVGTFPGAGKRKDTIGGLVYSFEKGGKPVGRIGTGFNEELLQEIARNPEKFVGRKAIVYAQGQFPSGMLRAPSFAGWEDDFS